MKQIIPKLNDNEIIGYLNYVKIWNDMSSSDILSNIKFTKYLLKNGGLKITKYIECLPKTLWKYMDCKKVWCNMPWSHVIKNTMFTKYLLDNSNLLRLL